MSIRMSGARPRFLVVSRVKAGAPCRASTLRIGVEIREQLGQFQSGFSVTYESPNFIIETASAAFQLQLLACRELDGENFVLELLPWCREYETAELPWIATYGAESKAGTHLPYIYYL